MTHTFIYNYASSGGRRHTLEEEMDRKTVDHLDSEFRRRVFAMMTNAATKSIDLGIGEAWRPGSAQLDDNGNVKPGFAAPGNSNHQSFPWESDDENAVAADMIGNLDWMEDNCGNFGLRTFRFVNNEPWHIQPAEIPASRSWRQEPWTLKIYEIGIGFDPANGVWGNMPRRRKPGIKPGSPRSRVVMYAQGVMKLRVTNFAHWFGVVAAERAKIAENPRRQKRLIAASERLFLAEDRCDAISVDGQFGPKTANAVVAIEEAFAGRKLDGRVLQFDERATIGRNTWFLIDNLADSIW